MRLLTSFFVLLFLNAVSESFAETSAEGEVCKADGVCFPTEDAAHEYYFNGVDINVDFGEDQTVAGEAWEETLKLVDKTKDYMTLVREDEGFEAVRDGCIVRNKLCSFWATLGECEANPNYMKLQCAPSCETWYVPSACNFLLKNLSSNNSCIFCASDILLFENRCPFDKNASTALDAGDLNKMFERITSDPNNQERLTILSQPPAGPWIVTLDEFLSPEESKRLIELGGEVGYERSKDVGEEQFDGSYGSIESKSRTSSNAWCIKECYEDETSKNVLGRIENTTGIPEENYEYLQLLQYQETQFYASHHGEFNYQSGETELPHR